MKLAIVLGAVLLVACGGGGGGGKDDEGKDRREEGRKADATWTPDSLLAAARERMKATCACPDQKCRIEADTHPNPFGEKSRPTRAQFTEAQSREWSKIINEYGACAMRK